MHFAMCTFPCTRSTFFVKPCLKQHAFLVHPLGVSNDFLHTPTLMFLDPKKGAQTKKRARNLAPASKFRSPGPPKGAHSERKKGTERGAFRVLRDERSPGLAGHPVHIPLEIKRQNKLWYPSKRKVNPRPLQLEGSTKPNNPCSRCTLQKGQTSQTLANISQSHESDMVFGAVKYTYEKKTEWCG